MTASQLNSHHQTQTDSAMADLDPAMLEKFQRFQEMLAASPDIVEALNSPEILALAAKTAAEKKQNQQQVAPPTPTPQQPPPPPPPTSQPQPEYPMVGYGVSDDVSVLSEMTTPTVMTRQTVEEDEFYPEVNGTGQSSSGLPRRLGVRSIGVSSTGNGNLPPPPPKPKNALKRHNARMARKAQALTTPMSKIVESQDAISVDLDATSRSTGTKSDDSKDNSRKGTNWSPKMGKSEKKIEAHPFFGSVGVGAVPRQARNSTYNNRTRRTKGRERGVNRNRSMPTNMKNLGSVTSSISASSDSLWEEDDRSKSSSEFLSTGSNTSTVVESNATPVQRTTMQVKSKASLSPPRPNSRKSFPRGVARNRSMPMPSKNSSTGSSSTSDSPFKVIGSVGGSSRNYSDDDDDNDNESHTRTSIDFDEEDEEVPLAKSAGKILSTPLPKDGRGSFQNAPTSRGKSVPRMRLVPVAAKSVTSAESSPAKMMSRSTSDTLKKPRSRSLSKYSNSSRSASISGSEDDDELDNRSRASAPANAEERRRTRSSKVLRQRSSSSDPKKARSRSLSKYSISSRSGSEENDDDDINNRSFSSAPVIARPEEHRRPRSSKVVRHGSSSSDPKKPRSRSLSKYSNSTRSNSGSEDDEDLDNRSRASAPVNSTDQKSRSASLKKYSYRVSSDEDNGDDVGQPPIPLRTSYDDDSKNRSFSSFLDESDEINSQVSDNNSDNSSTSSEERPAVTRRWKPPSADNSSLPPAFRSTSSNHSQKMAAKKSPKPAFRKLSSNNNNKTSISNEQKETRTETPSSDSDSEGEAYVRQTIRKPGKPRSKSPPPGKFPEKFEDHLLELTQVIQADFRPGDYLTGAESSFSATRKKRDQNKKKKNLGKESTAAARSGDWLGGGAPKKRTWKVKAVKEVKSS